MPDADRSNILSGTDPAIARWIRRELDARERRARSLIVTVWGDALAPHGGQLWLSTLFRLLAPLGLNERLVRTSVFRLARDGWLAAETSGRRSRYRLTADGARRFSQAYRRVYLPPFRPWAGEWDVVVVDAALAAGDRLRLAEELSWQGFGALAPHVHVRPARGDAPVAGVAESLGVARHVTAFAARDIPAGTPASLADRVAETFGLAALAAEYRAFLARFRSVVEAFARRPSPDPEQAFVVRTLLVHEYRRVRLRDPQLPPALLPDDWPGAAAYETCRAFYRRAEPLAEAHLAAVHAADGERLMPALPEFFTRFPAEGEHRR